MQAGKVLMAALLALHAAGLRAQAPIITVRYAACEARLDARALSALPLHAAEAVSKDGEKHRYAGPRVIDVLHAGCPALADANKRDRVGLVVRATGADGYRAAMALMEADSTFSRAPAILALTLDGEPLDAHEGPVKLIMPGDLRQGRHVRGVNVLEALTP